MKNFSRQRETVLSVLRSTDTHPTADWVYSEARKILPNISLGTVYRNLSDLSRSGEILSIDVGDGKEHFDGNPAPHLHLYCKNCSTIIDAKLKTDPFLGVCADLNFVPKTPVYLIYGYCEDCDK